MNRAPTLTGETPVLRIIYRLLKIKMFTYNDIGNLFFVIFNNISYNKLKVENIIFKKN